MHGWEQNEGEGRRMEIESLTISFDYFFLKNFLKGGEWKGRERMPHRSTSRS